MLYGRGSSDMKLDDALAVAALIELKRERYQPRRELVLALSGDEETAMKTTQLLAEELANAEMVLNVDGTGGQLSSEGKPRYFTWSGAEKTYADFELTVTSPGGHSSRPYEPNAIDQLSAALVRIGHYHFKPELSDLTRAYFKSAADYETAAIGAAMRAFAADPADEKAVAALRADPATIGKIGTTCVVTMFNGGHALNALPQRATAEHIQLPKIFFPVIRVPRSWRSSGASRPTPQFSSRTSPREASPPTPRRFVRTWLAQLRKPSVSGTRESRCFRQCRRAQATACGFATSISPATGLARYS